MATRMQRILMVLAVIASSALAEIVILHPAATFVAEGRAAPHPAAASDDPEVPQPVPQDVPFPWAPGIVAAAVLVVVVLVSAGFGTWSDEIRRLLCLQGAVIAVAATALVAAAIFGLRSAASAGRLLHVDLLPSSFGALTAGCCATALALLATRASAGPEARGDVEATEPAAPGPHGISNEDLGAATDGAAGAVATPPTA